MRGVWHTAMSLSSAPLDQLKPDAVRRMIDVKSTAALMHSTPWRLISLAWYAVSVPNVVQMITSGFIAFTGFSAMIMLR